MEDRKESIQQLRELLKKHNPRTITKVSKDTGWDYNTIKNRIKAKKYETITIGVTKFIVE